MTNSDFKSKFPNQRVGTQFVAYPDGPFGGIKRHFRDLLKADDAPTRLFPVVGELLATPALNMQA